LSELEVIHSEIMKCTKCELHTGRKQAVPGEGPVGATVMFVGEGPGEKEDSEGRPFVGAAGKFLTELLASVGLERSSVFITNIVKCRPPGNRAPRQNEVDACNPYLLDQIRIVAPRIICPLGTPAIKTVLGQEYSVSQVHGKPVGRAGRTILPLYHPAAALYDGSLRSVQLEDFKVLKGLIDGDPKMAVEEVHPRAGKSSEELQRWM
jgi:uracil-DNA glycosylase